MSILAAVSVISILMLDLASGPAMYAGLVMFGISAFGIFPVLMLMLMDSREIGTQSMGLASGVFFTIAEVGGFSGPLLMGTLLDATGGFLAGIAFLSALNVGILVLALAHLTKPGIAGEPG